MQTTVAPPLDHDATWLSDEELTALALAAVPEELGEDAVPWRPGVEGDGLLPDWYMPAPVAGRRDWRSRAVAASIIVSLALINGTGLCVTYGRIVLG